LKFCETEHKNSCIWLQARQLYILTDWLVDWLTDWLVDCLIGNQRNIPNSKRQKAKNVHSVNLSKIPPTWDAKILSFRYIFRKWKFPFERLKLLTLTAFTRGIFTHTDFYPFKLCKNYLQCNCLSRKHNSSFQRKVNEFSGVYLSISWISPLMHVLS